MISTGPSPSTARRSLWIPGNGRALYELAYSQYSKRDLPAALESAQKAALAGKPERMLPVMLGTIYDDMGKSNEAIAAYRKGLESDPDFFLLYYNLGTTYERLGQRDLARAAYENAVALRPRHASSHLGLARVYKAQGYRVPAILAAVRFLQLEPASPRSAGPVQWIDELFRLGVEVKDESHTNITVDPDAPKDEGDFTVVNVMVPIFQVSQKTIVEQGGKLEGPPEMDRLASFLALVGENQDTDYGRGFAAEYYVPFVRETVHRKVSAALAASALRGAKSDGIDAWITAHRTDMTELATLSEAYKWPSIRPKLPERPLRKPRFHVPPPDFWPVM
jgi:tetratricopeptide (TPR) repeat protein